MSRNVFLIPSLLSSDTSAISESTRDVIRNTNYYMVENIRSARRFISSLKTGRVIEEMVFFEVKKSTDQGTVARYFKEIEPGQDVGVISEAGCPGIADPGNVVVRESYQRNYKVVPLSGPSSIFLALMASGMNGQKFTFNGYLPIDKKDRVKRLKDLEQIAQKTGYTQIFMETPYRNNQLLKDALGHLNPATELCLASDITAPEEFICTKTINEWRQKTPDLHKRPTIFLINQR